MTKSEYDSIAHLLNLIRLNDDQRQALEQERRDLEQRLIEAQVDQAVLETVGGVGRGQDSQAAPLVEALPVETHRRPNEFFVGDTVSFPPSASKAASRTTGGTGTVIKADNPEHVSIRRHEDTTQVVVRSSRRLTLVKAAQGTPQLPAP